MMLRALLLLGIVLVIPACACTDRRSGEFHPCNQHPGVVQPEACECTASCPCSGHP